MTIKKSAKPIPKIIKQPLPKKETHAPSTMRPLICLVGDDGLVKEYSFVFQEKGIAVLEVKNLSTVKSSAKKITCAFELTLECTDTKLKNLAVMDESLPADVPIVSSTITSTLLSQSQSVKNKERFVGLAAFPTLIEHSLVELAPSLYTKEEIVNNVKELFASIKKETALVQDSVGMAMPRILCQIINEALFTVNFDIANPKAVDDAMKHASQYPYGPIEWGERIGFQNIASVLDALHSDHGEERYRVAPLLRQMAIAGTFWKTEENHTST
ncbi:MAG: 3-hydroxyacyl-CoA dehydrogenase family protein [Bacteroidota bacterium]|jgi:3-hydroxybutyryl-CoA dehydrogenase